LEISFWGLCIIAFTCSKQAWFEKDMNIENFGIVKIPVFGLLLGSPTKKCHLDVTLTKSHKVHYKEGSGASSQRLQVMWSLCLKLSLLNPPYYLHSICINRLLSLVVQVDLILNSYLWVCFSPIPKL
jgi:hypothetical protein